MKSKLRLLLVFIFLLIVSTSHSQTPYNLEKINNVYRNKIDSISKSINQFLNKKQDEIDSLEKSNKPYFLLGDEYNKFFTKYFAYVVLDKEGNPDGNYASLKPTSDDTRLKLNLSFRNKNIIVNGGAELSLSENVGNAISGKDVEGNTTFNFKVSYNIPQMRKLYYDLERKMDLIEKRKFYLNNLRLDYDTLYKLKYNALLTQLENTETRLKVLEKYTSNSDSLKSFTKLLDERKVILKDLNEAGLDGNIDDAVEKNKEKINTTFTNLFSNSSTWTKYKMGWVSGGMSYTNEKYKTYDSIKDFSTRINDFFFDKYAYSISFNHIKESSKWYDETWGKLIKSFYYNLNYTLKRESNYSSLDELDLFSNKTLVKNDTTIVIQSKHKIRDISGKQEEILWSHTVSAEATIIPSKTNFFGLHLGFNSTLRPSFKPTYNASFGFLFRFIDSEDDKAKVNFELFGSVGDLTDNKNTNKSLWERKVIGINTSIPFNKIFFN